MMVLLVAGMAALIIAAALPKESTRRLAINGIWIVVLAYPGIYAVLNDRAVYGAAVAPNPLLSTATFVAHAAILALSAVLIMRVGFPQATPSQRHMRNAALVFLFLQAGIMVVHGTWGDIFGWLVVVLVLLVATSGFESVEATECRVRWALRVYVLGSLISMVVAPTWALVPPEKNSRALFGLDDRLIGLTDSSNYLGLIAAISFALEVAAFGRKKPSAGLYAVAALAACALSQSRTPLLAIGLVLLIFVGRLVGVVSANRPKGSFFMFLTLAGAVIGPVVVGSSMALDQKATLEDFTSGRLTIWIRALEEFQKSPFIGYGHDVYTPEYWAQQGAGVISAYANAHNQVLESASRGGLLELIGLTVFVAAVWSMARRARPHPYGLAVVYLGVVCFTQLMFGTPFRWAGITWNLVQTAALLAIGVGVLRAGAETSTDEGASSEPVSSTRSPARRSRPRV